MRVRIKGQRPLHISIGDAHSRVVSLVNTTIVNKVVADPYEGEYVVTPKNYDQVLPTKNKGMKSDLTVTEIPLYEVSNPYGLTLIIGE